MDDRDLRYDSKIEINDKLINKVKRVISSALLLVVAFIISNLTLRLLTGIMAKLMGYGVVITFNDVDISPNDYHYWNFGSVLAVHFLPPILCLILGIVLLAVSAIFDTVKWYNMLIVWLSICLVNVCLSQMLFSPLGAGGESSEFFQTFAVLGTAMGMGWGAMLIFTLASILASMVWGARVCDEVLKFSFSQRILKTQQGKNQVVLQVIVFPVLCAALPLFMLHSNAKLYHGSNYFPSLLTIANLLLISVGLFIKNSIDFVILEFGESDALNHIPIIELILAIGAWLGIFIFWR